MFMLLHGTHTLRSSFHTGTIDGQATQELPFHIGVFFGQATQEVPFHTGLSVLILAQEKQLKEFGSQNGLSTGQSLCWEHSTQRLLIFLNPSGHSSVGHTGHSSQTSQTGQFEREIHLCSSISQYSVSLSHSAFVVHSYVPSTSLSF